MYICLSNKAKDKNSEIMLYQVIIGKNRIYGSYSETICAKEYFSNDEEKEQALILVKAIIFNYAEGQPNVSLKISSQENIEDDQDIFKILAKK